MNDDQLRDLLQWLFAQSRQADDEAQAMVQASGGNRIVSTISSSTKGELAE